MELLVTAAARRQIKRVGDWWYQNRLAAPELFVEELTAAFLQLMTTPNAGSAYPVSRPRGVRRLLMAKTRYHLYYTVDERAGTVTVRAIWHATRGRGPRL